MAPSTKSSSKRPEGIALSQIIVFSDKNPNRVEHEVGWGFFCLGGFFCCYLSPSLTVLPILWQKKTSALQRVPFSFYHRPQASSLLHRGSPPHHSTNCAPQLYVLHCHKGLWLLALLRLFLQSWSGSLVHSPLTSSHDSFTWKLSNFPMHKTTIPLKPSKRHLQLDRRVPTLCRDL